MMPSVGCELRHSDAKPSLGPAHQLSTGSLLIEIRGALQELRAASDHREDEVAQRLKAAAEALSVEDHHSTVRLRHLHHHRMAESVLLWRKIALQHDDVADLRL